jgi:hypothetical protein
MTIPLTLETAQKLGFPLCRKHNPPKIMVETEVDGVFACECGNTKDRRPHKPTDGGGRTLAARRN